MTTIRTALLSGIAASAMTAGVATAAPYDWSGFYAGINAAGGQMTGYSSNYYGGLEGTDWGGAVGGTVGINGRSGALVFGGEIDGSWSGFDSDSGDYYGGSYRLLSEWDWYATARVRAGVTVEQALVFVTGGIAVVGVEQNYCYYADCTPEPNYDSFYDETRVGIALGVGTEFALGGNATAKLEYLYIGLDTDDHTRLDGDPIHFRSYAYTGRIGINWQFDM